MTIVKGSTHIDRAREACEAHHRCIAHTQSMLAMLPHGEEDKVIRDVVSAANDLLEKANDAAEVILSEVVN